ncbi:MAG TPA: OmpA family protein [Bdellovibrionales bacterium]|nr:OmpA family protein [Bdellovibrionales bacterium]
MSLRKSLMLLTFPLAACVAPAKYNRLQQEHVSTRDELLACQAQVIDLEQRLGIVANESNRLASEKSQLNDSVNEMRRALEQLEQRKREAEKRLAEFRELTAKFKKLVDAGKLNIKVINGKMVLALSTDILFDSGSSELSASGTSAIKEVSALLATLKDRVFQIEGHTDNVKILKKAAFKSNWELASARAMTVLHTMLESGMPAHRISAASYGETQPVSSNKTPEGRASNRRIAIVVIPDLTGLPGFDELNKMASAE